METDFRANILILALLTISTGLWIDLLRQGLHGGWSWPLQPRRNVPWRAFEAVFTIIIVLTCVEAAVHQIFKPDSAKVRSEHASRTETSVLPAVDEPLEVAPQKRVGYTLRDMQIQGLAQSLELLLIPLVLSIWCRCRWEDFGLRRQGLLTDFKFAGWGLLLAHLPVYLVEFPLKPWRAEHPHAVLRLLEASATDWQPLAWIVLEVVVLAPLIEELLFRVLLQGALEREIRPVWAILLPALAFVAIHQPSDSLPLLPLAIVLGYVYYRRHSYVAIVALHGLFNGISLLCAVWSLKGS